MASAPPPQQKLGVKAPVASEVALRPRVMAPWPRPYVPRQHVPAVFGPPLLVGRRGAVRRKTRRTTRKRLTKKRRM
jgi:hypothetical protein